MNSAITFTKSIPKATVIFTNQEFTFTNQELNYLHQSGSLPSPNQQLSFTKMAAFLNQKNLPSPNNSLP